MPNSLKQMIALLFADDSTVYLSGSSLPELDNIVHKELHILCEWFKSNKLSLNVYKTNYMTIGKRGPDIAISLDGKLLSKESHVKFLGIIVDQNLNWCEHINHCKRKISSALFSLGRARQYITEDSSKLLYYTLVYPYLHNGLHLWGGTFKTYLKSLIILQKRAVRIIANASRLAHTCRIFQRLHVLSLEQLHDYCLGKFMYSQIYKLAPALFLEEIIHNRDVHQYHTRNPGNVHIKYYRTVKVKIVLLRKVLYTGHHCQRISLLYILSHHLIGCIETIFLLIVDIHKFKLLLYG